jgi:hypothetical protein
MIRVKGIILDWITALYATRQCCLGVHRFHTELPSSTYTHGLSNTAVLLEELTTLDSSLKKIGSGELRREEATTEFCKLTGNLETT